jgi:hypothetical protein
VLTVAREAVDEHRLVGTVASDLSTLAGARGHGGRHPVNTKMRNLGPSQSKNAVEGKQSPTSGWKTPVSSSSGARRAL